MANATELAMKILAKGGDVLHPSVQRALNPVDTYHQDILTAINSLFNSKNQARLGGREGIAEVLRKNKKISEYADKYSGVINRNYLEPKLDTSPTDYIKNSFWYNSGDFPQNISELAALERMGVPKSDLAAVHRLNQLSLESQYPWYNHGLVDVNNPKMLNPDTIAQKPLLANTKKFSSMLRELNPAQREIFNQLLSDFDSTSSISPEDLLMIAKKL